MDCFICLETKDSWFASGVCDHNVCIDCADKWYKEHKNCPLCRRELRNCTLKVQNHTPHRYNADVYFAERVEQFSRPIRWSMAPGQALIDYISIYVGDDALQYQS